MHRRRRLFFPSLHRPSRHGQTGIVCAECWGPLLEKLLAFGSRGLRELDLSDNPALSPLVRPLIRLFAEENFYILAFYIDGTFDIAWEDEEDEFEGKCGDTLRWAKLRNRQLEKRTQEAAFGILNTARVVFNGSSGPLRCSSTLGRHSGRAHLLDLPLSC